MSNNHSFNFDACRNHIRTAKICRAVVITALILSLILSMIFVIRDVGDYDIALARYELQLDDYIAYQNENRDALSVEDEENIVYIDIEKYGLIAVKLDPENAPITVENFKKLASEGFYDGLTFHRIIENFMIQGGDPLGNGTGGSGKTIKGEFALNGVENNIPHVAGTISMARGDSYNSASSQFFIVHETSSNNSKSLDGKYAAFGKVVMGMDIVNAIATVPTNASDKPYTPIIIRTVALDKADVENPTLPSEPIKPAAAPFFLATIITGSILLLSIAAVLIVGIYLGKEKRALSTATEAQRLADLERRKEAARQRQLEGKNKKKN